MREISPAQNATVEEFMTLLPEEIRRLVESIRAQKLANERRFPSSNLIDGSSIADPRLRRELIDKIAALVDENFSGRSDMCRQFALLLAKALTKIGYPSRAVAGEAIYFNGGKKIYSWPHAWVRAGGEVVDGNVDSLFEKPTVPPEVKVSPYWGAVSAVPNDRRLRQDHSKIVLEDPDVDNIWWPELEAWLTQRTT